MKIQKAHKILLDVSPETERLFVSWCGAARWSYNYGLERKKEAFEKTGRSPGSYALMKEVVALKKTDECAWLEEATMSGKAIDETGNRYGKLVVVRRAGTKGKYATWLCRCDCGGEKVVSGAYLRRAYTASCGCAKNALPEGEAAFNSMFSKMKRTAAKKGYEWKLSKKEVRKLTSSPCHYCGALPAQRGSRGHPGLNGEYYFNGLDRADNAIGYVMDNVVPCCKACNYAKRAMSQSEFYAWIERVYAHIYG